MSNGGNGHGWWQASDGQWYPPAPPTPQMPPGLYFDPSNGNRTMYWDGTQWLDQEPRSTATNPPISFVSIPNAWLFRALVIGGFIWIAALAVQGIVDLRATEKGARSATAKSGETTVTSTATRATRKEGEWAGRPFDIGGEIEAQFGGECDLERNCVVPLPGTPGRFATVSPVAGGTIFDGIRVGIQFRPGASADDAVEFQDLGWADNVVLGLDLLTLIAKISTTKTVDFGDLLARCETGPVVLEEPGYYTVRAEPCGANRFDVPIQNNP